MVWYDLVLVNCFFILHAQSLFHYQRMFDLLLAHLMNIDLFFKSLSVYLNNFTVNNALMLLMMIFMFIGAIDKIRGNKFGYGEKFDEGFLAMGPLAIAMIGVVAMAPVLRIVLQPFIAPVFELFGASPAMFAASLLANDMGGYPLAMELAEGDEAIGNFAGLILGSMMGATIVFSIPVALTIIKKEDQPYLACGVLVGMVSIPVGCFFGGLFMNLTSTPIAFSSMLANLVPVIIIALLIVAGLWYKPARMMSGFQKFGSAVTILITAGTAFAVFQYQTGIHLPLLNLMVVPNSDGIVPLEEGIRIVGLIAIMLIGAFPLVHFISTRYAKPLSAAGKSIHLKKESSAGFVATIANNIPMFHMLENMDPRGKILNVAFAVGAAFLLGDHLGFTAGANSEMILPVVISKLTAGIVALIIGNFMAPLLLERINVHGKPVKLKFEAIKPHDKKGKHHRRKKNNTIIDKPGKKKGKKNK